MYDDEEFSSSLIRTLGTSFYTKKLDSLVVLRVDIFYDVSATVSYNVIFLWIITLTDKTSIQK